MKSLTPSNSTVGFASVFSLAARISFAAVIILIPFRLGVDVLPRPSPSLYAGYTDLFVLASDTAVVSVLAFWSISLVLSRRAPWLGPRYLWIPLAILTAVGAASAYASYDPAISAYHALRLLVLFWFYLFIVNEVRSIPWLVAPVTIGVILQSVVALAQFIAQRSVGLRVLGESQLEPAWSGVSVVVVDGVRLFRAYGLTEHPNVLGGCLAFSLVFLFGLYLEGAPRPAILASFALGVPALLVTFSRGAWLAFAVGCTVLLVAEVANHHWLTLRQIVPLFAASLMLVAPILLADARFFGVRLDFGNSFQAPSVEMQSLGERSILIASSAPLILQHPILGVGLGASPMALQHQYSAFPITYEPPHSAVIDALLETGLAGAAAYLFLLLTPLVLYLRSARLYTADRFATTCIAVMLALVVAGLFDYYTWLLQAGLLLQWLAWGLWGAATLRWPSFQFAKQTVTARTTGVSA